MLGNTVVGYRVELKRLHYKSGTREVIQSDVEGFNTDMSAAAISEGLGNNVLNNIDQKTVVDSLQLVRFPTTSQ